MTNSPFAELKRIQEDIKRKEESALRRGSMTSGERYDLRRMQRRQRKWEVIIATTHGLKCPDCSRGPLLKRANWCVIRLPGDMGGPRVTCKGCVKTKFKRIGNRFIYRNGEVDTMESFVTLVHRFTVDRVLFTQWREATGMGQMAFAAKSGLTRAKIRKMETIGERVELTREELVQLAVCFKSCEVNAQPLRDDLNAMEDAEAEDGPDIDIDGEQDTDYEEEEGDDDEEED